jgi:hypothetical protein
MSLLSLVTAQFADLNLKENFSRIVAYIEAHSVLHGFKFVQFELNAGDSHVKIKHGLGFVPDDIIRLRLLGDAHITFHRDKFTTDSLCVSSSGHVKVRILVGSFHSAEKQTLTDETDEVWHSEHDELTATEESVAYSADTDPILIHEDFLGDSTDGVLGWVSASTGASLQFVNTPVTTTQRALGVLELDTGTTATGRAALRNSTVQGILFGYAAQRFDARAAVATAHPTAAEAYMWHFGFGDHFDNGLGTTNATDGAYFVIDETSAFLQCRTANNGTLKTEVTRYNIPAAGTFARYAILVSEDGKTVKFYLNEQLVATIIDQVPIGAGRWTNFGAKLMKTNGTTLRATWLDYVAYKATFSSNR